MPKHEEVAIAADIFTKVYAAVIEHMDVDADGATELALQAIDDFTTHINRMRATSSAGDYRRD